MLEIKVKFRQDFEDFLMIARDFDHQAARGSQNLLPPDQNGQFRTFSVDFKHIGPDIVRGVARKTNTPCVYSCADGTADPRRGLSW